MFSNNSNTHRETSAQSLSYSLIELKSTSNASAEALKELADTSLRQIKEKQYDTEMRTKGIQTTFMYGVAFSVKNVEITAEKEPMILGCENSQRSSFIFRSIYHPDTTAVRLSYNLHTTLHATGGAYTLRINTTWRGSNGLRCERQ